MPDLSFRVGSAEAVPFAATPLLSFEVDIENATPEETIHTIALRAQIRIDATRRRYDGDEKGRLLDLFGEPDRWSRTLQSLLWTHTSVIVPAFTGGTRAGLQVPCTFDFNVAATKYFAGVSEGDIPLSLLFSGTVFYASPGAELQAAPISWDKEAQFRLPVQTWRAMMDLYYPNTAWLALRRDVFERVNEYKTRHGIPSWEAALSRLLDTAEKDAAKTEPAHA